MRRLNGQGRYLSGSSVIQNDIRSRSASPRSWGNNDERIWEDTQAHLEGVCMPWVCQHQTMYNTYHKPVDNPGNRVDQDNSAIKETNMSSHPTWSAAAAANCGQCKFLQEPQKRLRMCTCLATLGRSLSKEAKVAIMQGEKDFHTSGERLRGDNARLLKEALANECARQSEAGTPTPPDLDDGPTHKLQGATPRRGYSAAKHNTS